MLRFGAAARPCAPPLARHPRWKPAESAPGGKPEGNPCRPPGRSGRDAQRTNSGMQTAFTGLGLFPPPSARTPALAGLYRTRARGAADAREFTLVHAPL